MSPDIRIGSQEYVLEASGNCFPQKRLHVLGARDRGSLELSPQSTPRIFAISPNNRLRNAPRLCVQLPVGQGERIDLDRLLGYMPIVDAFARMADNARIASKNQRRF